MVPTIEPEGPYAVFPAVISDAVAVASLESKNLAAPVPSASGISTSGTFEYTTPLIFTFFAIAFPFLTYIVNRTCLNRGIRPARVVGGIVIPP